MNVAGYAAVKSFTWVDANVALNAIIEICKGMTVLTKTIIKTTCSTLLLTRTSKKNHYQRGQT